MDPRRRPIPLSPPKKRKRSTSSVREGRPEKGVLSRRKALPPALVQIKDQTEQLYQVVYRMNQRTRNQLLESFNRISEMATRSLTVESRRQLILACQIMSDMLIRLDGEIDITEDLGAPEDRESAVRRYISETQPPAIEAKYSGRRSFSYRPVSVWLQSS